MFDNIKTVVRPSFHIYRCKERNIINYAVIFPPMKLEEAAKKYLLSDFYWDYLTMFFNSGRFPNSSILTTQRDRHTKCPTARMNIQ